jgi:hypothetical protein
MFNANFLHGVIPGRGQVCFENNNNITSNNNNSNNNNNNKNSDKKNNMNYDEKINFLKNNRRLTFMVGFWKNIHAKNRGYGNAGPGQPFPDFDKENVEKVNNAENINKNVKKIDKNIEKETTKEKEEEEKEIIKYTWHEEMKIDNLKKFYDLNRNESSNNNNNNNKNNSVKNLDNNKIIHNHNEEISESNAESINNLQLINDYTYAPSHEIIEVDEVWKKIDIKNAIIANNNNNNNNNNTEEEIALQKTKKRKIVEKNPSPNYNNCFQGF